MKTGWDLTSSCFLHDVFHLVACARPPDTFLTEDFSLALDAQNLGPVDPMSSAFQLAQGTSVLVRMAMPVGYSTCWLQHDGRWI